jgi:hypothetical protein
MTTKQIPTRTKLTVRVWQQLLDLLTERTDAICFRRDQLLERVIAHEIDHLVADIPEPNSSAARAHIEHHFKLLLGSGGKQISLALSQELAKRLDAACTEKNVPRESFLNRVILLLIAKPKFLDTHLFGLDPEEAQQLRIEIKNSYDANTELANGFAPLPIIADVLVDPFWGYRAMIEKINEWANEKYSLYGTSFHAKNLIGLNCHLADIWVPGTAAYKQVEDDFDLGGEK